MKLPENTSINKYTIKLKNSQQPPYKLIYNLGPLELEIFKTYIKTYLKTDFIRLFKFLAVALILFNQKPDGSFCLCVNYCGLNKLTIKNQ